MAVRISRSYKVVHNSDIITTHPQGSDLTTITTSPNPLIMANGWAVHIQGWIQDFCRRGHQPSSGGCQHIIFTKFSEKLHESEKILVRRGGMYQERPTLDPPLSSYWMFHEVSWQGTFEKKCSGHTPSISCSFQENLTNLYGGARFPLGMYSPPHTFCHKVMFSQASVCQRVGWTHWR